MSLSLARVLRPNKFSEVVGQDLVKSMLKNSLYLDKFFPAYLLSGSRGCGKTTTGRVFAAGINCERLDDFRKDASSTEVPCSKCNSCLNTQKGSHPDFLEIDAASHTGVDNVRQILESATYAPRIGRKKVYLIDEAHMLSKAAFNAFLKMLEEPPKTALFILATTEFEKIPMTVRSRCFLGLFYPLEFGLLEKTLIKISKEQKLNIDQTIIKSIVRSSGGCLRDAINLLEQVSLVGDDAESEQIDDMFGSSCLVKVLKIFGFVVSRDVEMVLKEANSYNFYKFVPKLIFSSLVEVLNQLLRVKYNIAPQGNDFYGLDSQLEIISQDLSLSRLKSLIQLVFNFERTLHLSNNKHSVLKYMFVQMCDQLDLEPIEQVIEKIKKNISEEKPQTTLAEKKVSRPVGAIEAKKQSYQNSQEVKSKNPEKTKISSLPDEWNDFLKCEEVAKDRLLFSIFKNVLEVKKDGNCLILFLPKVSGMLKDKVSEAKQIWIKSLGENFVGIDDLRLEVSDLKIEAIKNAAASSKTNIQSHSVKPALTKTNFKDKDQWPKLNMVLENFPGKVEEIR